MIWGGRESTTPALTAYEVACDGDATGGMCCWMEGSSVWTAAAAVAYVLRETESLHERHIERPGSSADATKLSIEIAYLLLKLIAAQSAGLRSSLHVTVRCRDAQLVRNFSRSRECIAQVG